MTLTEFLLARIAEDEADVQRGMMRVSGPGSAARVLAECETKRRIVEEAEAADWAEEAYTPRPPEMHGYTIVRLLAGIYADHPDYREEWRP